MKYIIIGSKGFVGSSIYKSLKDHNNDQIISISRSEIELLSESSSEKIKHIVNEGDTIIFCAAEAPVKNLKMFTNNISMLNNILQHLVNVKIKSFVYLSSDAVYTDSMNSIDEEYETNPDNLHGLMHLTREKIITNVYPNQYLIVRPTLIYGYGDPHCGYGPNQFIDTSIKKKKIELFGKGEELRDHIWIEDLTVIFKELIINNKIGIFNLVSGQLLNFSEIAEFVINLASEYNIKVDVSYKKRKGTMPHNGFRKLNNKKVIKMFPQIKTSEFKENIRNYFKKYLLENTI